MISKRAAGEIITWAIGLIAIVLIILISIMAFNVAKFGEKNPVSVFISTNIYSSEMQRISVYAISEDFNGASKGKTLNDIYLNADESGVGNENYMAIGVSNANPVQIKLSGFPKLNIEGYEVLINLKNEMNLAKYFYLSCKKCSDKYVPFGLEVKK